MLVAVAARPVGADGRAGDGAGEPPQARAGHDGGDAAEMVDRLESEIDALDERFDPPKEFTVPGGNVASAWLDLARTVVRRAERHAAHGGAGAVARRCRTSTGCRTCCGRWRAGRTPVDGSTLRARDVDAGGQT